MTLMLPKLIDDLQGKVPRSQLMWLPNREVHTAAIEQFIKHARVAEKFDFGELPLELHPTDSIQGRPTWQQPPLTEVEIEAWEEGLIPLPSNVCWFEFVLGSMRSGLLIMLTTGDPKALRVQRVDYQPNTNGQLFHGTWVERDYSQVKPGAEQFKIIGEAPAVRAVSEVHRRTRAFNHAADYKLAIYLTLMLSSLTTEFEVQAPIPKVNQARIRRGDEPQHIYRIVTLVPQRFIERHAGGTHLSPRLHWRRTHKRHFEEKPITGRAVFSEHETYRGKQGWWITIVPRMLVGLAEVGTVEHEYRIKLPTRKEPA